MIRVVMQDRLVYKLHADIKTFADWVNGIPASALMVNDFQRWLRTDGSYIYLDRLSVVSARQIEPEESNE